MPNMLFHNERRNKFKLGSRCNRNRESQHRLVLFLSLVCCCGGGAGACEVLLMVGYVAGCRDGDGTDTRTHAFALKWWHRPRRRRLLIRTQIA